jgi:hypothetical protein
LISHSEIQFRMARPLFCKLSSLKSSVVFVKTRKFPITTDPGDTTMRAVPLLAAVIVSQATIVASRADDFVARFSSFDISDRAGSSTVGVAGLRPIKSSLPATLFGSQFADQSFFGVSTHLETIPVGYTSCTSECTTGHRQRVSAVAGFGDTSSVLYVSAGIGVKSAEEGIAFGTLTGGYAPERWTTGIGASINLTPSIKVWGQLDYTAYAIVAPSFVLPGLSPASGFSLTGGISLPFDSYTSDTFAGKMAAPKLGPWRWWHNIMQIIAPDGSTPR